MTQIDQKLYINFKLMRYKIGDRVKIKSLDWYNKNKDEMVSLNKIELNLVEK